jgi:hypothetical protein
MKSAKTLLIAISLPCLIAILWFANGAFSQNSQLESAEPGSIDEMVMQAIADGQTEANNAIVAEHEEVGDFDVAKTSYSVFVATANSKQSLQRNPFVISTWFRFTVNETLSVISPHICVSGGCNPPAGVAAAGTTELLVPKSGGTIVKDGVTVDLQLQGFPDFTTGQKYLLFVDYDSSVRVGAPALGALGVFRVNADGTVTAISASSDLKDDIAIRFGNSLSQIRSALGSSAPSGCSTTAEQSCYNSGGEWDSSTCHCYIDPCTRKPWLCP